MSPKKVSLKSAKPTAVKAPVVKKKSTKAKHVVTSSESESESGSESSSASESESEEEIPPPPPGKKTKSKTKSKKSEPVPITEVHEPIADYMKELIATLRDISVSLDIVAKHVSEDVPAPAPVVAPVPAPVDVKSVFAELDRILNSTNKTVIISPVEVVEELRLTDVERYGSFQDLVSRDVIGEDVETNVD